METSDRHPRYARNVRAFGLALALVTLVIAVIATQWPFEYRITEYALRQRWRKIDWSWFPRTPMGRIRIDRDLVQNLVMLVPLGMGFALWRRAGALRVMVEALLLGFATSTCLELAQLFTRSRYATFADVWRNTASCALGAAIVLVLVSQLRDERVAPTL